MITVQLTSGASVDQRIAEMTEILGAVLDALGPEAFSAAMARRQAERQAAAEEAAKQKAEAEKAAAAVPAKLKRGQRK